MFSSQQPGGSPEPGAALQPSRHSPSPIRHPEATTSQPQQQQHAPNSDAESFCEPVSQPLPAQSEVSSQAAAQSGEVITISRYLSLCNPTASSSNGFCIFCAVLSFLRPLHAQGLPAQSVRPSQLLLHRSGHVTLQQSLPVSPIEAELYTSPEQLATGQPSLPSEIFSLGILFFELLNPIHDQQLRSSVLRDVRRRVLPPGFMEQHCSHETAFLMALIHPDAKKRPSVAQIISSNLLNMLRASFHPGGQGQGSSLLAQQQQQQQHIAQQARSAEEHRRRQHHLQQQDQNPDCSYVQQGRQNQPQQGGPPQAGVDNETLLDFLSIMRQTTLSAVEKAQHQLAFLDAGISEVNTRALSLHNQQWSVDLQDELQQQSSAPSLLYSQASPPLELKHPASRKRQRSWEAGASGSVSPPTAEQAQADHKRERITQSCHNMDRAFSELERKFFFRRERPAASQSVTATADLSDSSHVGLPGLAGLPDHLTDFSSDLIDFSRYSQLKVSIHCWSWTLTATPNTLLLLFVLIDFNACCRLLSSDLVGIRPHSDSASQIIGLLSTPDMGQSLVPTKHGLAANVVCATLLHLPSVAWDNVHHEAALIQQFATHALF